MIGWVLAAVASGAAVFLWRINAAITRNVPRPGDRAPEFTLPDQNGKVHGLGEFRGKWLVLYFYPRDDTPGCTEQAGRFRDAMRELERLGAIVCGVSVDSSDSHAQFARKYRLPFTLLADRKGEVAKRYGSLRTFGVFRVARRNTFLIDPGGVVAKVYVGVSAARNALEVTDDLRTHAAAA